MVLWGICEEFAARLDLVRRIWPMKTSWQDFGSVSHDRFISCPNSRGAVLLQAVDVSDRSYREEDQPPAGRWGLVLPNRDNL